MPLSTLTQLRIDVDALALETGNMTETERAKLAAIEAGATANATNAQLRDRSTHTGTQPLTTVTETADLKIMTGAERTGLAALLGGTADLGVNTLSVGGFAFSQLHFASRADFVAATIPAWVTGWTVEHMGVVLQYRRDASGTAITSANGIKGSPASVSYWEHWGAAGDYVIGGSAGTDNTAAINAAIAWGSTKAAAAGGKIYRHTGTIYVSGTRKTLDLNGNQLILDDASGVLDHFVVGDGTTQSVFPHVTNGSVSRVQAATAGWVVSADKTTYLQVDRLRIFGQNRVFGGVKWSRSVVANIDVIIEDILGDGFAPVGTSGEKTYDSHLHSSRVIRAGGDGINVGDYVEGLFFDGLPVFYGCGGWGVNFAASSFAARTISVIGEYNSDDNDAGGTYWGHVANATMAAIWSSSNSGLTHHFSENCNGINIAGGKCYPESGAVGCRYDGSDVQITGMSVAGGATSHIFGATCRRINISGGACRNASSEAFDFEAGHSECSATGVAVTDCAALYAGTPSMSMIDAIVDGLRQIVGSAQPLDLRAEYGGTADAITLSLPYRLDSVPTGLRVRFRASAPNTGAATININGLGAASCVTPSGIALPADYVRTDADTVAEYTGSQWRVFREIERGSASGIYYTRWPDGTQTVFGDSAGDAAGAKAFSFPKPFSAVAPVVPQATAEALSAPYVANVSGTSTTGLNFSVWNAAGARTTVTAHITVTGRWY